MQDNRQLYILGAGGLFAILCLLPSWDFTVKIIISTVTLAVAMALAFVKYGQDRIPLEEYLWRQLRYRFGTWRYSYRGSGEKYKVSPVAVTSPAPSTSMFPVVVDWDGANIYFLLTVWLAVVGAYFSAWLYMGGSVELANWLTGKY
jgi:hypothetical protein